MPDDPPTSASPTADPDLARGARLGALVVLGWVLHDLAVGWANLQPHAALGALAPSLVAVAAGAAWGLALALHRRAAPLALVLLGAASVLPRFVSVPLAHAQVWLPRYAFLCTLAWWIVAYLPRGRAWVPRAPLALLAAYLACAAVALVRLDPIGPAWPAPYGPVVAAVAIGLFGWLRGRRLRLALQ